MEMRTLGQSSIQVSKICLGTMTWGSQNSEREAHQQIDYALEQGINFLDTAELYSVPPSKERYGRTEECIGSWFAQTQKRDQVVLASKVSGPGPSWAHTGKKGLTPEGIRTALENSLKRLQTDYIDLYQIHWPQRQVSKFGVHDFEPAWANSEDRIAETLHTLGQAVQEGKIRIIGLSNETPWGVMHFLRVHEQNPSLPRIETVQNVYSLVSRILDIHLSEVLLREKVSLLPYSPLAGGLLTGKYLHGQRPEGARFSTWGRESMPRYLNTPTEKAVESYSELAQTFGLKLTTMALSFVTERPYVASNIIGATTMEQLEENIASHQIKLGVKQLQEIDAIHLQKPNPAY